MEQFFVVLATSFARGSTRRRLEWSRATDEYRRPCLLWTIFERHFHMMDLWRTTYSNRLRLYHWFASPWSTRESCFCPVTVPLYVYRFKSKQQVRSWYESHWVKEQLNVHQCHVGEHCWSMVNLRPNLFHLFLLLLPLRRLGVLSATSSDTAPP